jgi:hypothetical protein
MKNDYREGRRKEAGSNKTFNGLLQVSSLCATGSLLYSSVNIANDGKSAVMITG